MKEHERVFKGMELINSVYAYQRNQTNEIIKQMEGIENRWDFGDLMFKHSIKNNTEIYNLYKEYYELNQS